MSIATPRRLFAASLAAALLSISGWAFADKLPPGTVAIVDTPGPGGPFGTNGFDVFKDQRVAARFTVPADGDMRFVRTGLWMMNNSGDLRGNFLVSLQTDAVDEGGPATLPSGVDIEHWKVRVQTYGWSPVEQFFVSRTGPTLKAGHNYWIVVASNSPPFIDPVWTFARKGLGWSTTTFGGAWQQAGESGALTLHVDAVPVTATAPTARN